MPKRKTKQSDVERLELKVTNLQKQTNKALAELVVAGKRHAMNQWLKHLHELNRWRRLLNKEQQQDLIAGSLTEQSLQEARLNAAHRLLSY